MKQFETITTIEELREIIGFPSERVANIEIARLDRHCKIFIERSPFVLISSVDDRGNIDISPKGDPPGFVKILDDKTLVIPDRPGNRRADTFTNILLLQNANVGLLFLIPGVGMKLRVKGQAKILKEAKLLESMAVRDKIPNLAIAVTIETAFFHCSKCIVRPGLWEREKWPSLENIPSLAETMVDVGNLKENIAEMQELIDRDIQENLY